MCDCSQKFEEAQEKINNGWKALLEIVNEEHKKNVERLRGIIRELQEDRERLLAEPEPVYAVVWFRDCDCAEAHYARSWENERDFQNWCDDFYESAEGPCSVSRCTKEQHDEFEDSTRDRVLEAFEDGRGTSVLI